MDILTALQATIPIIVEALNLDAQICLCDREKTIGVWYGKTFKMDIEVGSFLDANHPGDDMVIKAIETGIGSAGNLPEFVYGVPTNGILTPIRENGKVVGVLSTAISIKNNIVMNEKIQSVNHELESSKSGICDIVQSSEQIVELLERVKSLSNRVEKAVAETETVVLAIQNDSRKSNMIALNATIEAARVGEAGRGFTVVSKEMGALAKNNSESAKLIANQIMDVAEAIELMTSEFDEIVDVAKKQVATTQNITDAVMKVADDAKQLAEAGKKQLI